MTTAEDDQPTPFERYVAALTEMRQAHTMHHLSSDPAASLARLEAARTELSQADQALHSD